MITENLRKAIIIYYLFFRDYKLFNDACKYQLISAYIPPNVKPFNEYIVNDDIADVRENLEKKLSNHHSSLNLDDFENGEYIYNHKELFEKFLKIDKNDVVIYTFKNLPQLISKNDESNEKSYRRIFNIKDELHTAIYDDKRYAVVKYKGILKNMATLLKEKDVINFFDDLSQWMNFIKTEDSFISKIMLSSDLWVSKLIKPSRTSDASYTVYDIANFIVIYYS